MDPPFSPKTCGSCKASVFERMRTSPAYSNDDFAIFVFEMKWNLTKTCARFGLARSDELIRLMPIKML